MVIKVYTSGISGNKEVKKRQQRILMILESKNIKYETVDITEPGNEPKKQFMQEHADAKDSKHPLPPQIFNEDDYCGDYVGFDLANENDELEIFLKMPIPAPKKIEPAVNGSPIIPELSASEEYSDQQVPERNADHINEVVTDSTSEKEIGGENGDVKPDEVEEEEMEDEQQELDSSLKDEEMEQENKLDADEMEDGAEGEE